jgi:hypothetical protein
MSGAAYLYDPLNDAGRLIDLRSPVTFDLNGDFGYYVLAPVGPSGIAMLGDKGNFVGLGKKRVPALLDDGQSDITVAFATGEKGRTVFGYSAYPVAVTTIAGTYGALTYDASTQIFSVNVHPVNGKAHFRFRALGTPARAGGCVVGCTGGGTASKPTQDQ